LSYFTNQLVNLLIRTPLHCVFARFNPLHVTLTGASAAIYDNAWNERGTVFVINKEPCGTT